MDYYEWPVNEAELPKVEAGHEATLEQALDAAVAVLWALTGRWYGIQAVEARPCPPGVSPRGIPLTAGVGWMPVLDSGVVRNVATVAASCREGAIVLPGPVIRIDELVVDGKVYDAESLQVDGDFVRRTNGEPWPAQDLSLPATEAGTWAVRYLRGTPPPPGAAHIVALLASEFYAAATGGKCQLPRRTTSVTRQGVTVSMVDPTEIFDTGATGITEVDLWVKAHNPYGLREPSRVWSPDLSVY